MKTYDTALRMPHVRQLDGLRAIAIVIVFMAHCGLEKVVPGGFGVTIFFFLSGYLITSLLRVEYSQTGSVDLGAFYLRRAFRILPPLYITMAVVYVANRIAFPEVQIDNFGVFYQAIFLGNYSYLWHHPKGVDIPLWSLAVEEHFYILFPLIYSRFLSRRSGPDAARICAYMCAAVLAVRLLYALIFGVSPLMYYWSHTRIDSILFGCCLALNNNPALDPDSKRPGKIAVSIAVAALIFCLAYRSGFFRETFRYTIQGCALYVIFAFAIHDKGSILNILRSKPLSIIGLYSYTLYLIHVEIITIFATYVSSNILILIVLAGLAAMGYCALMYTFIERPFARLRKALHRENRGTAGAPAVQGSGAA